MVRPTLVRRGAGGDMADPGDPRGDDRHVRRGDHRVAPARDIAPDPADRDVAVAEHDPRQGLDLDILQRGALDLGKISDLGWANLMSSIVCGATLATSAAISSAERRKLGGDHLSKRSLSSRTATSPRLATSAM